MRTSEGPAQTPTAMPGPRAGRWQAAATRCMTWVSRALAMCLGKVDESYHTLPAAVLDDAR